MALPPSPKRSRAMTLIELLIAIAIISILIAIVIPAFSRVKKSSLSAADAGQLRQIGIASNQLSVDYRNKVIVGIDQKNAFGQGVNTPWFTLLRPYFDHDLKGTDEVKALVSPADPSKGDALVTYRLPQRGFKRRSYAVNGRTFDASNFPLNKLFIPQASELLLIGNFDLAGTDASGINSFSSASLNRIPTDWYGNGRANFLFLDGHIEAIPVSDLLPGGSRWHLIDRNIPVYEK